MVFYIYKHPIMTLEFLDVFSLFIWVLLSSIITLIGFYINARNQKKERNFTLNKEIYFNLQRNLEIIFSGLAFYNANNKIVVNSLIHQTFIEEDFMSHKIKEREWENFKQAQDLMYLYFSEENKAFIECMDKYKEVIDIYFEKILKAPRIPNWISYSLSYSPEDKKEVLKRADVFNKTYISFIDSLKIKLESYKKNII